MPGVPRQRPSPYDAQFFQEQRSCSYASATRILPRVLGWVRPASVVDVGCGTGTWLRAAAELGVADYLGIDGYYVDRRSLEIPKDRFMPWDLNEPIRLDRQFDLVMSLEVAEHLPEKSAAKFVSSLARLGRVVLFSAALPYQGGTNHVNEQWPDYWAALFAAQKYRPVDCIRSRFWSDDKVAWWYAQNAFLYVHEGRLAEDPALAELRHRTSDGMLRAVHPKMFTALIEQARRALGR